MQFDHDRETEPLPETALSPSAGGSEFARLLTKDMSAAEAMTRAEVDIAIATAKAYPRNVRNAVKNAMEMAGATPQVASEMRYVLPRSGRDVEGPTIRLAEIIGSCWGNIRYDAQVIEEADSYLVARASCHDLESNVQIAVTVRRRILDRNGRRYNEDMVGVTGQAACAIALRNAIFKVIPMGVTRQVYDYAMNVAFGKAQALDQRRDKALAYFRSMGVTPDRLVAALGVDDVSRIGLDELKTLLGWRNALTEGETTIEEVFPAVDGDDGGSKSATEKLVKKLAKKAKVTDETPNKETE